MMMKIISLDQASLISGWCIFEDGVYIDSGIITKNKKIPIIQRVPQMAQAICEKIETSNADVVVIEGIQNQGSIKTTLDLARLQGGIMMWCEINHKPLYILSPSEWRSALKFKLGAKTKRDELKVQAENYVSEHYNLDINTDESEAICINVAAQKIFDLDDDI
jgi:Holliday junction resolvasome RuvABC endonuclease subunit